MQTHRFELFADYFQFYLQDEAVEGDLSDSWMEQAHVRRLALAPGTIGVRTARSMDVPVVVEVRQSEPVEDLAAWDHAIECSIDVISGRLVVAGCTDYFQDAARIDVVPGCYRVRVLSGALGSLNANGLEGDDHYKVVLWRAPLDEVRILKQWRDKTH